MKTILTILAQLIAQILVFLFFFILLGMTAEIARKSISATSGVHWLGGVVLGIIWLIGVVVLCWLIWYAMSPSAPERLRKYILIRKNTSSDAALVEQFPVATLSALICAAMLVAIFALTAMSAILASQGVFTYTIDAAHEKPMTELLFRLYMWHTIDMVPFVDVWETYDVAPPIRPTNILAKTIVLVFRTAIIGFAISLIVQLVRNYRGTDEQKNRRLTNR